MSIVYIKGEFVDAANASISITERGFRFGDGVFESIKIQHGKTKQLQRHLKRLNYGLTALRIKAPKDNIEDICQQLIKRNATSEGILRLSATRGIGSIGYMPDVNGPPTIIAEILPLPEPTNKSLKLYLTDWRKPSCNSLPVGEKLANGINSTLAIMQAKDNDCDEALILNDKDEICEASSANIFWQINGTIYTPDIKCGLVKGIAREILLENLQIKISSFNLDNLKSVDSVMICNSIRGAMNVTSLSPQEWYWHDDSLAIKSQKILGAT